jgi:adenosyl cobinamide kinase/adenosyl cobinamide phosphate guanylyltransferase/NaMN:DMB phosphoribosyltransferase
MSDDRWNTVLVLGGIRSGKSAFAEALVADAPAVRYVATAVGGEDDPEWRARIEEHQRRRPQSWTTEETGADPARLAEALTEAKPDETLLVDDLGGWVAGLLDPARQPNDDEADVAALAAAVRGCPARLVLVSPEVGLSVIPATPVGRAFADALGATNQALAGVCDRVALVVAGRTVWLKEGPDQEGAEPIAFVAPVEAPTMVTPQRTAEPASAPVSVRTEPTAGLAGVLTEPTMALPLASSGQIIQPGMDLPLPDDEAGPDARDRLTTLDFAGAGLGVLVEAVEFAAATQATATPRPWIAPRVLLISGGHTGGAAAGDDPADAERRLAQVTDGVGVLNRLAAEAGADIAVVRTATVGEMADGPVLDGAAVDAALRRGWELADAAADDGRDLLVLASIGFGTDAAATAVMAATSGAEPAVMLPRVTAPGGRFDDNAWMVRCAAVRDAMHRIRQEPRGAKDILRQLGGPDVAVATGALLGAAARRLPVLLDGPIGVAAALVSRDLGGQARHWCLLPDAGNLALVRQGADVLGLATVLDLGLGLGEGANALATLPLLTTAIALARSVPTHPALPDENALTETALTHETALADETAPTDEAAVADETAGQDETVVEGEAGLTDLIVPNDDADVDLAEPEPDGPGPATTRE